MHVSNGFIRFGLCSQEVQCRTSNSMLVARYALYPDVKTKGMSALPRLALFTSEHVSTRLPFRPFSTLCCSGISTGLYVVFAFDTGEAVC